MLGVVRSYQTRGAVRSTAGLGNFPSSFCAKLTHCAARTAGRVVKLAAGTGRRQGETATAEISATLCRSPAIRPEATGEGLRPASGS